VVKVTQVGLNLTIYLRSTLRNALVTTDPEPAGIAVVSAWCTQRPEQLIMFRLSSFYLQAQTNTHSKPRAFVLVVLCAVQKKKEPDTAALFCSGEGCEVGIPPLKNTNYLGRLIDRDGNDKCDVIARVEEASRAFGAVRSCVFTSGIIPTRAKKRRCMQL
jgi:hypothetical protein